jgi:fibronectin type 3 domain-containing protein
MATNGDSADNIDLTWNAVSGASSYRVLRSLTNSSASASYLASSNETGFSDTTVEPEIILSERC